MASTLVLCLQRRNGAGEKPGHLLHYGESARGPADSPNQHNCIIIAFLSLLLSPAFSIPLAGSHSSYSVYLLTTTYTLLNTHKKSNTSFALSLPLFSSPFSSYFSKICR
ncbi:hypothetical protein AMECASPLE_003326 [Ameca splendens]|uniref:Uncharacterized protein n=1 Tax=Ameca splendens TaxID=208324 RepID=A0ABV0Y9H0_9TELE